MDFMDASATTLRPVVGERNVSTMNFFYRFVFILFVSKKCRLGSKQSTRYLLKLKLKTTRIVRAV